MLFFNNCVKSRISRHFVPKIPPFRPKKPPPHHVTLQFPPKKTATPESWVRRCDYSPSGFNNRGTFFKLFQQRFGCTPKQFRDNNVSSAKSDLGIS